MRKRLIQAFICISDVILLYFALKILLFCINKNCRKVKGKVFPYSLPSVGPGADPGVHAVSPQVT